MIGIFLLTMVAGAVAPGSAQGAPAKAAPAASKPAPAAWPKLDGNKVKDLGLAIDSLKKTISADGVEDMAQKIAAFGKGAVPYLYESLSRQKPAAEEDQPEDVKRLLIALNKAVESQDSAKLAGDISNKCAYVRRFALRKINEYGDAACLPSVKKALSDPDEEVKFEAILACFALGSIDGLHEMLAFARDSWPKLGVRIRAALEKHRSDEATDKLTPLLNAPAWQDVSAALRLLGGIGTKKCTGMIVRKLDETDNRVISDAVNALRGIVDNEKPIDRLSAFDLAEQVALWKKKA